MGNTLRAAVIGLGRMGSTIDEERGGWNRSPIPHAHTACYVAAGVQAVAGSDPFDVQREAYQKKWGVEALYADYREMVERERPDIVSVATTARPRARIVLDVVEIGAGRGLKAIWAEKPIAVSLAEADQMVEACQRAQIVLAVGCSRNWHPAFTRTRDLIEAGELGDLLQVIGLGSNTLSTSGSHLLAATNYLAGGRVQWAFGHIASDEQAARDEDLPGNGYLQYDNGVQGYVRAMACGAADWDFEVIGSQGRVRTTSDASNVDYWKMTGQSLPRRQREWAKYVFPHAWPIESPNLRTVRDLLRCLETGKEPNCSGDDARHALEAGIAIRESHRRGGIRVSLPLADRSLRIVPRDTLDDGVPKAVRRAREAAGAGS